MMSLVNLIRRNGKYWNTNRNRVDLTDITSLEQLVRKPVTCREHPDKQKPLRTDTLIHVMSSGEWLRIGQIMWRCGFKTTSETYSVLNYIAKTDSRYHFEKRGNYGSREIRLTINN